MSKKNKKTIRDAEGFVVLHKKSDMFVSTMNTRFAAYSDFEDRIPRENVTDWHKEYVEATDRYNRLLKKLKRLEEENRALRNEIASMHEKCMSDGFDDISFEEALNRGINTIPPTNGNPNLRYNADLTEDARIALERYEHPQSSRGVGINWTFGEDPKIHIGGHEVFGKKEDKKLAGVGLEYDPSRGISISFHRKPR